MKKRILTVAFALVGTFGAATQADAEPIIGLNTANQIFTFDSAAPAEAFRLAAIVGTAVGDVIVGIDRRPANGLLYAVAQGIGGVGRIYTIDATTGVATLQSTLNAPLIGTSFGVDFNPQVDRLRVTSNADQNLRIAVDTGATTVDGTLAYAPGDSNSGRDPNVISVAYSNNFAGTGSTVLRDTDIAGSSNILATQNPPNNGTLNTSMGINVGDLNPNVAGYDISGLTGTPYFAFTNAGATFSTLYTITNGTFVSLGQIGAGNVGLVTGLAAAVGSPVPEPATMLLLGTGLAGIAAKVRRRKTKA